MRGIIKERIKGEDVIEPIPMWIVMMCLLSIPLFWVLAQVKKQSKIILALDKERLDRIKKRDIDDNQKLSKELQHREKPYYCKTCKYLTKDSRCRKHLNLWYSDEDNKSAIVSIAKELPKVKVDEDWCYSYEEEPPRQ